MIGHAPECKHPSVYPNGNCTVCGVFLTSAPGLQTLYPVVTIAVGSVVKLKGKKQQATVKSVFSGGRVFVKPTLAGFHSWDITDLEVVAKK